jgi:copper-binding protein NosD
MRKIIVVATVLTTGLVTAAVAGGPAAARQQTPGVGQRTLVAAPNGSGTACTRPAPCALRTAVAVSRSGDTVIVTRGTYHVSGVTITHRLNLIGQGRPVIDATTSSPTLTTARGVTVTGRGAAGTLVRGLTVENATEEGILARATTRVTIADNVVTLNNRGVGAQKFDQCAPAGPIPGDCGEGLHLMSVTNSRVLGNLVARNAGGILVTDELGPAAHNLIARNVSVNNALDCGITLAGHNPTAVSASTGARQPGKAGIYRNLVTGNVANDNGVKGEGGGFLMAGGAPFTGVYANAVVGNVAERNGLAGVVLHHHFASDLNDNLIARNRVGRNNLVGDRDFTPADTQTTGILVASGLPPGAPASTPAPKPVTGTVVTGNVIANNHFGIWTLNAHVALRGNRFINVAVPVLQR